MWTTFCGNDEIVPKLRYIKTFTKSLEHQIWKTKKQDEMYFIR